MNCLFMINGFFSDVYHIVWMWGLGSGIPFSNTQVEILWHFDRCWTWGVALHEVLFYVRWRPMSLISQTPTWGYQVEKVFSFNEKQTRAHTLFSVPCIFHIRMKILICSSHFLNPWTYFHNRKLHTNTVTSQFMSDRNPRITCKICWCLDIR